MLDVLDISNNFTTLSIDESALQIAEHFHADAT